MTTNKTKTELGRHSFEARVGYKQTTNGQVVVTRSGMDRVTYVRPGVVTFSPYSRPGWRELIRLGRDATTGMVGNRLLFPKNSQYKAVQTSFDYPSTFKVFSCGGELFATSGDVPTIIGGDPNAIARASEAFVKSMLNATHELRGASVLAEAHEAVRMLASPAKSLRKEVGNLYHTARNRMYRDRNRSVAAMRDVVSGTWLEWNFGVKPLIQDANDAAAALNQLRSRELQCSFPVRGSAIEEKLVSFRANEPLSSASLSGGGSTILGYYCRQVVDFQTATLRGSIRVPASPGKDVPLSMQFGVGFNDLAPAVWEGLPWSWFYDYFFNVSSVIDAWSAPLSELSWVNRTVRNGRRHTYNNLRALEYQKIGSNFRETTLTGGQAEAMLQSISRSSLSAYDVRTPLRLKLPGFGTQWANLAALASYGTDLRALRRAIRGR